MNGFCVSGCRKPFWRASSAAQSCAVTPRSHQSLLPRLKHEGGDLSWGRYLFDGLGVGCGHELSQGGQCGRVVTDGGEDGDGTDLEEKDVEDGHFRRGGLMSG